MFDDIYSGRRVLVTGHTGFGIVAGAVAAASALTYRYSLRNPDTPSFRGRAAQVAPAALRG
jgi:hypothetical protein